MTPLLDAVDLETIPLFRGLTPSEQRHLHDLLGVRTFSAGVNILTAEEPGDVAYIVLDGTVKVQVDRPDGTAVIIAILRAGEVAGEMSLDRPDLAARPRSWRWKQTTLAWLTHTDFWNCLRSMPTMAFNLAGIHSRRLRLSNAHVVALATLDIEGRLADQLLALGAEYGEATADGGCRIPFRLTQGDLAALVGASRVRVNQILVSWKQNNFLSRRQAAYRHPHQSTRIGRAGARHTRRASLARGVKQLTALAVGLTYDGATGVILGAQLRRANALGRPHHHPSKEIA